PSCRFFSSVAILIGMKQSDRSIRIAKLEFIAEEANGVIALGVLVELGKREVRIERAPSACRMAADPHAVTTAGEESLFANGPGLVRNHARTSNGVLRARHHGCHRILTGSDCRTYRNRFFANQAASSQPTPVCGF